MAGKPDESLITSDPGILGGKPVIAGTRISVQFVLEKLADGWSIDDLLNDYPQLACEQVDAALAYAARHWPRHTGGLDPARTPAF